MPDGILPALGRFAPGYIAGGSGLGETEVTLITNLLGEPIRFSLNEDLSTLVSSATLLILDADISELGVTEAGVYSSEDETTTEEDESLWNVVYSGASVEPNQLVMVTEIVGSFTTNIVDGITQYIPDDGSQSCTTYWRVVTFTVYEDDKGVPYCDISMESLTALILEKTVKDMIDLQAPTAPVIVGGSAGETVVDSDGNVISTEIVGGIEQQTDFLLFVDEDWFDGKRLRYSDDATVDGYAYAPEDSAFAGAGGVIRATTPDEWLFPFLEVAMGQLTSLEDGYLTFSGGITGLVYIPCMKVYQAGDEVWKCIEEILSFNRIVVRFKRDFSLVQWTLDDEGYGDSYDVGDYGVGIKATYTKDNVYNYVDVSGFIGVKDSNGNWKPNDRAEVKKHCFSAVADGVLNGRKKQMPSIEIPADYLLKEEQEVQNWGEKELYKSFLQARGISVDSDSIPLEVEVGMTISGTSRLFGSVSLLITSFSRTTDAQANTVNTAISGRASSISGPEIGWA